jgi:uncharacterized OsmC-like protein
VFAGSWEEASKERHMSTVITRYKGDRLFEAEAGSHRMQVDVTASMGGRGRAPTPTEMFAAGLGSCVAAFVVFYCERMQLDSRGIEVAVTFEQHASTDRITAIHTSIKVPRADTSLYEGALLGAAEHCPIKETIKAHTPITFSLEGAAEASSSRSEP